MLPRLSKNAKIPILMGATPKRDNKRKLYREGKKTIGWLKKTQLECITLQRIIRFSYHYSHECHKSKEVRFMYSCSKYLINLWYLLSFDGMVSFNSCRPSGINSFEINGSAINCFEPWINNGNSVSYELVISKLLDFSPEWLNKVIPTALHVDVGKLNKRNSVDELPLYSRLRRQ